MGETSEPHSLRGAIDRPTLLTIRDVINDEEPLATAELDDYLDPTAVEVAYEVGLCRAESCQIDIQLMTQGDYKVHYTDSNGVDLRWGKHPHGGDYPHVYGLEHYHPPPNAPSDPAEVKDSCIEQSPAVLVTRAVLKLWRVAYHTKSLDRLNSAANPP